MNPSHRAETPASQSLTRGWLDGLTWKGVALIGLLTLLHALRRTTDIVFEEPWTRWLHDVGETIATGMIVLLLVMVAVVVTYNCVRRWRRAALAVAIVVASACGTWLLMAIESGGTFEFEGDPPLQVFVASWPRYALLGLLLTGVFVYFRRAEDSEFATRQAELDRASFAQQMEEARLQVLQAQIEPHFLFNTLATVRKLYRGDRAAAEAMLDNLMRYLTVALPQMRSPDSTLDRETALVEAFLEIQKIRMGRRLSYAIDVPAALRDARVPPMMLLTLAENAIKHGLSPLLDGGFIHLTARRDSGQLRLEVSDSGQGFVKSSGGGTGLANIRARLAALYGATAELGLMLNHPQGVTAVIRLPYTAASTSGSGA